MAFIVAPSRATRGDDRESRLDVRDGPREISDGRRSSQFRWTVLPHSASFPRSFGDIFVDDDGESRVRVLVYVCVCVCEREGESEKEREKEDRRWKGRAVAEYLPVYIRSGSSHKITSFLRERLALGVQCQKPHVLRRRLCRRRRRRRRRLFFFARIRLSITAADSSRGRHCPGRRSQRLENRDQILRSRQPTSRTDDRSKSRIKSRDEFAG